LSILNYLSFSIANDPPPANLPLKEEGAVVPGALPFRLSSEMSPPKAEISKLKLRLAMLVEVF
jgi:hypothetical protein